MPWRTTKVPEQRMEFVVAASRREKTFKELCEEFQISCRTGYTWWNRYKAEGLGGMQERSRRPHHIPRRTAEAVEQRIVELRRERPDWGARKIRDLLQKENGIKLPGSTIHRILLRYDLVRDCDRRAQATQRFERERPNQLWQMDFKGPKGWNQPLGPLSVLDDHSRYAVALENTGTTQSQAVQAVLERAFRENGMPEEMLMDHGTPWFNTQGRLGWSQLTVWLMERDIELYFSGCRHPQTQGFHRSLTAALLRRGVPAEDRRQPWLDAFRYEYNCIRPHEALQMKTPHQLWQKSTRLYQEIAARWEYAQGSEIKEVDSIGQLRLDGRRYYISKALAGREVGLMGMGERILVYYRRTLVCELDPLQSRSFAGDRSWSCKTSAR